MIIPKREESPLILDDVKIKDEKSEESENEHFEDEMKDEVNSLPDTQH